jgi:hypothetical protein
MSITPGSALTACERFTPLVPHWNRGLASAPLLDLPDNKRQQRDRD